MKFNFDAMKFLGKVVSLFRFGILYLWMHMLKAVKISTKNKKKKVSFNDNIQIAYVERCQGYSDEYLDNIREQMEQIRRDREAEAQQSNSINQQ